MAQKTLRSKLAPHSRFERLRAQHIKEHGYISCTTAMAVAAERLAKGELRKLLSCSVTYRASCWNKAKSTCEA